MRVNGVKVHSAEVVFTWPSTDDNCADRSRLHCTLASSQMTVQSGKKYEPVSNLTRSLMGKGPSDRYCTFKFIYIFI